jgi:thymidylate synthase
MLAERYIEANNLSLAWGKAVQLISEPGRKEVAPLIVSVTGFNPEGTFAEDAAIRKALDVLLRSKGSETVETVANTIFPVALWNPAGSRKQLFERYKRIGPRVHKASRKNRRGIYFERMIANGAEGRENQLDFVIHTYRSRKNVRRSLLQVAIFDPKKDHSAAALLGFPCLQHVTFAPTAQGLSVNAFYATQYLVKRAYGNYVGLCRLGRFVAHELGIPLARVTCYTGVAELDVNKKEIKPILAAIDREIRRREQET